MLDVPYNPDIVDKVTDKKLTKEVLPNISSYIPPAKVPNPLLRLAKGGRTRRRHNKKRRITRRR